MLLQLDGVGLRYGTQVLAENVCVRVDKGDRICLVGRNGEGKSSLLRLLQSGNEPDEGEVILRPGTVLATLEQELPDQPGVSVYEFVASGLGPKGDLLAGYRSATEKGDADRQQQLHVEVDAAHAWELMPRIDMVIDRLELDADAEIASLSGGWQRRAALGKALVGDPDLLILDEPTNHLDISAVEWLENFLSSFRGALLFVTHDRALAERLATQVWDLDRGRLRVFRCGFNRYLADKQKVLEEEQRHEALFDKKLAEEETWIRQGIKARRTRNEGRVRALHALRRERQARRTRQGTAKLQIDAGESSGKLVAEVTDLSFGYPGAEPLIRDFSCTLMRGDKVGLIGPNGVGKSTLIQLLLGQLKPDSGTLRLGTKQQIAYFDQRRNALEEDQTVLDNIAQGRESLEVGGKTRHVMSYLADFLFTGPKAHTRVSALSGGERNRALLAKLFSQPANILVLDEPTNDLDVETLELLEELLSGFKGTVLLVSHDRVFLDNVVDSCIAFEGDGRVREYVGGYSDFVRQAGGFQVRERAGTGSPSEPSGGQSASPATKTQKASSETPKRKKLSYKLQRELDALPAQIESLEKEISDLEARVSDPDFYQQDAQSVEDQLAALTDKQAALEAAFERWSELDEMS
ncbi:ATP-binding cassette domain-containing protein [Biformimicrobium ophioploci]|uniref:ATP-binding protein Uup n=1 Tax=Biformimicrobium ophioploci TaxID=3036711 RepID=A0ABQ6M1D4_9GAMM|nr:ATP-binding cassette domain-containing protein [Microbulbifer sp. NKW57]GMG88158.1 ATP-binding cassette domain-containing protein [Microbulbifer sp. NKW57]